MILFDSKIIWGKSSQNMDLVFVDRRLRRTIALSLVADDVIVIEQAHNLPVVP